MKFFITCFTSFALVLILGSNKAYAQAVGGAIPDYISHFVVYAVFSALICAGLVTLKRNVWIALPVVFTMGLLDESMQYFLSFRSADIKDLAVDTFAALIVCFVFSLVLKPHLKEGLYAK